MLPYATLIQFKKGAGSAVYIQISHSIIAHIRQGTIKKGIRLPGTRQLAALLGLHRNTIVAVYETLEAQGWIKTEASSGAFVSDSLPEIKPKKIDTSSNLPVMAASAGFAFKKNKLLSAEVFVKTSLLEINDGLPDERLAPMDSLARVIRSVLRGERGKLILSYSHIAGNENLRRELCTYLNGTRGFQLNAESIFITRGTIMALYLSLMVLIKKGDQVIVGSLSYRSANMIIRQAGGVLVPVQVDDEGLCTDSIEKICSRKKIRAIYLTPHHHYPTTVTMSPARRMALLAIAQKYGIAILEDDYDYDYHYQHRPYLPLASADPCGMVIYIGSFSKTLSPAFRIGYLAAPSDFIEEVGKLRRIIDRQGDNILEQALSELLHGGEIRSHLRKTLLAYRERRNLFCDLLQKSLANYIEFNVPEGGLAVWGKFDKKLSLPDVALKARSLGLYISNGVYFDLPNEKLNATRLGFASLDLPEIEQAVVLLKKSILKARG